MNSIPPHRNPNGPASDGLVERVVMAPVPEREFECLGDPAICDNPRGCGCAPTPERTYTRAELLTALAAERHACSIVVWMTLMEALEPDADDKGLDGWMREAERRVKNRQYENDAMELGRELYAEAQDAVGRLSARVQELEAAEEGASTGAKMSQSDTPTKVPLDGAVRPGSYFRMPFAGPLKAVVVQVVGPGLSGHHTVRSRMGHEFQCLLSSCHPFPQDEGDELFGIARTMDEQAPARCDHASAGQVACGSCARHQAAQR